MVSWHRGRALAAEASQDDDADLARFLDAVVDRYGYDLRGYAPASLRRRVQATLRNSGISSLPELERRSLADPALFARVLDSLTVRVSEMFRDPSFFQALRTRVLPLLRAQPRINIWHAGCATGEEVYSTAIVLAEEGLLDRCQIYATDLSPHAVDDARLGVYAAEGLAAFSARYRAAGGTVDLARYVTEAYGRVAFHESLRRNALFFQHDLVGDHLFEAMDLIFCRNVLIYFGRALKELVLTKLGDGIRPGGFLCLGRSEHLSGAGRARFTDFARNERIYQAGPAS
jgi:chemotaxis protein methyltransferase CheR